MVWQLATTQYRLLAVKRGKSNNVPSAKGTGKKNNNLQTAVLVSSYIYLLDLPKSIKGTWIQTEDISHNGHFIFRKKQKRKGCRVQLRINNENNILPLSNQLDKNLKEHICTNASIFFFFFSWNSRLLVKSYSGIILYGSFWSLQ